MRERPSRLPRHAIAASAARPVIATPERRGSSDSSPRSRLSVQMRSTSPKPAALREMSSPTIAISSARSPAASSQPRLRASETRRTRTAGSGVSRARRMEARLERRVRGDRRELGDECGIRAP